LKRLLRGIYYNLIAVSNK
jgi:hypothetical protein